VPSIPYDGMAPPQHDPLVGKDPTLDAIMDGVEDREPPASSDLQFQDFKPEGAPMGDIESQPMMQPQTIGSMQPAAASQQDTDALIHGAGEDAADAPMYTLAYYQKFFDVDTTDVVSRLRKAMTPFTTQFIEEVAPNPDLYGPFWVCTTLVFSMAAAGNFANWLGTDTTTKAWTYDFNKVTLAGCVVYGYVLLLPMGINFTAMYFTEAVGFIQLVCVYGYSMTIFILASYLCIIPSELLRWVFVVAAFAVSGGVIYGNIGGRLDNLIPGKGRAVTIGLVGVHAALALVFKMYFFEYL